MNHHDIQDRNRKESSRAEPAAQNSRLSTAIFIATVVLGGAILYVFGFKTPPAAPNIGYKNTGGGTPAPSYRATVLPPEGIAVPVRWGDTGAKLASVGVIDRREFEKLYTARGGFTKNEQQLLDGSDNGNLVFTAENAPLLLNLLWALGLGTRNAILDNGPMRDSRYGDTGRFASTGGWTLADSDAMNHYSRHPFVVLAPEQQQRVERVSDHIYRPCCNNPTHFPDCNHGMAMLGLLELLAAQNASEKEMYRAALAANTYWFPDAYLTIATYLQNKGVAWQNVNPQELLGRDYSSASGYAKIASQVVAPQQQNGGGCSVDTGSAPPQSQQSECGI